MLTPARQLQNHRPASEMERGGGGQTKVQASPEGPHRPGCLPGRSALLLAAQLLLQVGNARPQVLLGAHMVLPLRCQLCLTSVLHVCNLSVELVHLLLQGGLCSRGQVQLRHMDGGYFVSSQRRFHRLLAVQCLPAIQCSLCGHVCRCGQVPMCDGAGHSLCAVQQQPGCCCRCQVTSPAAPDGPVELQQELACSCAS